MPTIVGFSMAAILFLRFDRTFLIEKSIIFALSLGYRIEDEWFGGESGIQQVVEYMHCSLQWERKNLGAEIGILIELEIHPLFNVVLTDALETPRAKLN
jgi:hypothetical protein